MPNHSGLHFQGIYVRRQVFAETADLKASIDGHMDFDFVRHRYSRIDGASQFNGALVLVQAKTATVDVPAVVRGLQGMDTGPNY